MLSAGYYEKMRVYEKTKMAAGAHFEIIFSQLLGFFAHFRTYKSIWFKLF
jgi:hypothetical protein